MRLLSKIILTVLCTCLLHCRCKGLLSNLFVKVGFDYYSKISGLACWNYSEYVPSCGWKYILFSSLPITSIVEGFEFFNCSQVNSFTFILNGLSKYDNLSLKNAGCPNIGVNVITDPGVPPDITVNWYCVCNSTTAGVCQVVPGTDPTFINITTAQNTCTAQPDTTTTPEPTTTSTSTTTQSTTTSTSTTPEPITTTTSTTTQSTTTSTSTTTQSTTTSTTTTKSATKSTTASTTTSTATQLATPAVTTPSSVMKSANFNKKLIGSCPANILTSVSLWNPDLIFCAVQCFNYENCTGVNYWEATQRCDIVSSDIGNIRNIPGCNYYVIEK